MSAAVQMQWVEPYVAMVDGAKATAAYITAGESLKAMPAEVWVAAYIEPSLASCVDADTAPIKVHSTGYGVDGSLDRFDVRFVNEVLLRRETQKRWGNHWYCVAVLDGGERFICWRNNEDATRKEIAESLRRYFPVARVEPATISDGAKIWTMRNDAYLPTLVAAMEYAR